MKDIIALAVAIGVAISLTACTSADATSSDKNDNSNLTTENENIVEGKVTKVNGNEIIIDIGKIKTADRQAPEGTEGSGAEGSASGSRPSGSGSRPEGEASAPSGSGSRPEGSASRPSGSGSKPSGSAITDGEMAFSMPAATTIELTGESMTIEVPVGTPVYMTVRGSSSKVDFTRLSEDNIVKVKLNDDKKVLSVTVVS